MRTIHDKRTTAVDSLEWLATLEQTAEIKLLREILEVLIQDYDRVINRHGVTEVAFWRMKIALSDAADLLEDHMEDYAAELEGFTIVDVPITVIQLVYILLNDALDQITGTILRGRRTKGWSPITDRELAALEKYGLMA